MKLKRHIAALGYLLICISSLLFISGCASPLSQKKTSIFFPPPPSEPRIQFLTSLSTSKDLVYVSPFKQFLMGPPPVYPIKKPYGLKMNDGVIYICDTGQGGVLAVDYGGRGFGLMSTVGGGRVLKPIHIDIDHEGNKYIADAARGQVIIYGPDNTCTGFIGSSDKAMKPSDVLADGENIYVADMKGHTVKVFDRKTHAFKADIPEGNQDIPEEQRLYQPLSIALYKDGDGLLVSDGGAFRVQHYDMNGKYIKTIGSHGDLPGQFARPKGIDVDRDGRVHVVDAISGVVQMFDKDGALLTYFGGQGSPASLVLPADVEISYDGVELFREYIDPGFDVEYLVLVSSQFGTRKLSIFGYGSKKK